MLTLSDLLYYYVSFVYSLFSVFIVGKFVLSFYKFNVNFKLKIFLPLLVGVTLTSIIFSLVSTKGVTIQTAFLPIILFLMQKTKRSRVRSVLPGKEIVREFLIVLIGGTIIYFYQSSFYFDYVHLTLKPLFADNYIYAQTSESMSRLGSENFNLGANYFFDEIRIERTPYRYGDLWLNAFFLKITSVPSIFCFYCITIPIFISILMIGIYELLNYVFKLHSVQFAIAFILLFVSVFFIPYLNPIDDLKYVSEPSLMGTFQQKLGLTSCIAFLAFYTWKKNRQISIILLISIPLFYVAYVPSIWGGVLLYSLFVIFRNKWNFKANLFYYFIIFLIIGLIGHFFLFYHIFGSHFSSISNPTLAEIPLLKRFPSKFLEETSLWMGFKAFVMECIHFSIPNLFYYLKGAIWHLVIGMMFFFPFFFFFYRQILRYKSIVLLIIFILFGGLVGLILNDGNGDNYQFFTNNLIFISILVILGFIRELTNASKSITSMKSLVFLLCVVIFNLIPIAWFKAQIGNSKLDSSFITQVMKNIPLNKDVQILFFINENGFSEGFYDWVGSNDLYYIQQFSSNRIDFNIGNPEVYLAKNMLHKFDVPFYSYWSVVNYWRKKTGKKDIVDFIKEYKIQYLYFDNEQDFPKPLTFMVKKLIQSNNGRKFIILRDDLF